MTHGQCAQIFFHVWPFTFSLDIVNSNAMAPSTLLQYLFYISSFRHNDNYEIYCIHFFIGLGLYFIDAIPPVHLYLIGAVI